MPTILVILGWRLSFNANEGNEPFTCIVAKMIWNVNFGWIAKTLTSKRIFHIICHREIKDRSEKLSMNILNILNNGWKILRVNWKRNNIEMTPLSSIILFVTSCLCGGTVILSFSWISHTLDREIQFPLFFSFSRRDETITEEVIHIGEKPG